MMRFSAEKFHSLPLRQQHKKACELLRKVYDTLLCCGDYLPLTTHYAEMALWTGLPPLVSLTLESVADRYHHHCAQAHLHHKEHNLLPRVRQGDSGVSAQPLSCAFYLDNIRSAHNVGSIIRTVEAFSLGSIHFSPSTAFIDNKQVKDTAMGCERWVSCHNDALITSLPRPLIALETSEDALSLHDFIFPDIFTLAVGNEEYGCSHEILTAADIIIEIPLHGKKNSLNVANAFAVVAGEISRQKRVRS